MELFDLKIFQTVANSGSILAASHTLHYAQSGVSTRIRQLEEELRSELFYRNNRGIELTKKGELFLSQTNGILSMIDKAVSSMIQEEEPSGSLRIGTLQTLAETSLPRLLSDYHNLYPNVVFSIRTGISRMLVNDVVNRRLDAAFVACSITQEELCKIPFTIECPKLAFSYGDSNEDIHNLLNRTLLVLPSGCSYRRLLEIILRENGINPTSYIEFDSLGGIISCVSSGVGVGLLPISLLERYTIDNAIHIRDVPESYSKIHTYLIYRKDMLITKAFEELTNLVYKVSDSSMDISAIDIPL